MKNRQKIKKEKERRRKRRVRVKIFCKKKKPRLTVYRSLKHIYAQIIDDEKGRTLVSASDFELKKLKIEKEKKEKTQKPLTAKVDIAYKVGKLIAKKSLKKKIKKVVFDRSKFKFHGRVRALAEGARAGGLEF